MKSAFNFGFTMLISLAAICAPAQELPKVELRNAFPNVSLFRPLWLCEAPDGSKRLFVAQQDGKVFILPREKEGKETKLFFDISDRKPLEKNEEGLLGFAFHPKFKKNGKFYVFYSKHDPRRSVVSEFQVAKDNPGLADKSTERILLEWERPEWNHDGGELAFGPDHFLYIAVGDGGGKNNQFGNGQKPGSLMAKILRIDVDSRSGNLPYGIPRDNPFVRDSKFRPEIWAWGLRNPWRFSFDRQTGELFAGDVGQDKWEEIDLLKKGGNYGWSFREGLHEFGTEKPPAGLKLEDPILEYPHVAIQDTNHLPGLSITGGYVYRGKKLPALQGIYLYADFVNGTIWGLRCEGVKVVKDGVLIERPKLQNPPWNFSSFGEDLSGEVYVLSYEGNNGKIYEFVARNGDKR